MNKSNTNEFDLAKETFTLLLSKMGDYEKLVDLYTETANVVYESHKAVQGLSAHLRDLAHKIESLKTQQAQMYLEAVIIRNDLDQLLALFKDVAMVGGE